MNAGLGQSGWVGVASRSFRVGGAEQPFRLREHVWQVASLAECRGGFCPRHKLSANATDFYLSLFLSESKAKF